MKASISLPIKIRKFQSLFLNALQDRYAGKVVMVQPNMASLSLVAFMKEEGASAWLRCQEKLHMLPGFALPNRVELPPTVTPGFGDVDDALQVEASIGAESQIVSQSQSWNHL